jgi:protein-S-isoprenylcysteine O-methyltransferase Ste14
LGLLLNNKISVSFLPRRMAIILGWTLLSSGVLLWEWFYSGDPACRYTDGPQGARVEAGIEGTLLHTRNPGYLSLPMIYVGLVNLAKAPWVILLLPEVLLMVQRDVIECEEHYLEA